MKYGISNDFFKNIYRVYISRLHHRVRQCKVISKYASGISENKYVSKNRRQDAMTIDQQIDYQYISEYNG